MDKCENIVDTIKQINEHWEDKETGILEFTYVVLESLGSLEGILTADPELVKKLSDAYALYASDKDMKYHICPIYQIPKKDLENRGERDIPTAIYERLIEKYGKELVDLLVVDEAAIKKNILWSIKFLMNDIYNSDDIIIKFETIEGLNAASIMLGRTSSIPDLIYEVIQENFILVDQKKQMRMMSLYIKERSYEDVKG